MSNKTHYIKAGWLIDGSGAPVQKRVLLTITNGIIKDISQYRDGDTPDPQVVKDLSRCTILPPLVDCHVHLALSGSTDAGIRRAQMEDDYDTCKQHIEEHLHYLFSHGVLAVRDGGDRSSHTLFYKTESEKSDAGKAPVIIQAAGTAFYKKNRYGSFLGSAPGENEKLTNAVESNLLSADHIKLIHSGINSLSEFALETAPQFSLSELQHIVSLATRRKKQVMVHANGQTPVKLALQAGCHSIEHGFFMGDENLKRMADTQTVWIPTAVTMKAALNNMEFVNNTGKRSVISKTLDHQLQQIDKARQYGVPIAMGTDSGCSGVIHGESAADEIKLFLNAGYSLSEAIQCASSCGAELLGMNEIGILRKGMVAHFIVTRATPAMVPRKLSYLEAIYLHGEPCDKRFFNKF